MALKVQAYHTKISEHTFLFLLLNLCDLYNIIHQGKVIFRLHLCGKNLITCSNYIHVHVIVDVQILHHAIGYKTCSLIDRIVSLWIHFHCMFILFLWKKRYDRQIRPRTFEGVSWMSFTIYQSFRDKGIGWTCGTECEYSSQLVLYCQFVILEQHWWMDN